MRSACNLLSTRKRNSNTVCNMLSLSVSLFRINNLLHHDYYSFVMRTCRQFLEGQHFLVGNAVTVFAGHPCQRILTDRHVGHVHFPPMSCWQEALGRLHTCDSSGHRTIPIGCPPLWRFQHGDHLDEPGQVAELSTDVCSCISKTNPLARVMASINDSRTLRRAVLNAGVYSDQ